MLTNKEIAFKIKPITNERINVDYSDLCEKAIQLRNNQKDVVTDRCRIGNDIVDYFTFEERLRTKSKYNINYFEFVERIDEFKEKKFIRNMLTYYKDVKNKNNTKNEFVVLKEVFNICIGAINIFRPLAALEIYSIYNPSCVLDICAGWGGRCLGAAVWNVPKYIGIDTNNNLKDGYDKLKLFLNERTSTDINMYYSDAVNFDFNSLQPYDMVFTSPPYYLLEKYSHFEYCDKKRMTWIRTVISLFFQGLTSG